MFRKEFFTVSEVAEELTARTNNTQKITEADVHELASSGELPVCFIFRGNIGVFDRKSTATELFVQAKRFVYFPRGHLRTRCGVSLGVEIRNLHGKIDRVDQLRPGPVEIVKPHRGFDGSQCLAPTASEVWWLLDESDQWKFTRNHTKLWPASEWLFHVDDLPIPIAPVNTEVQLPTPKMSKREVRKFTTQEMYATWKRAYRSMLKESPDKSDVWFSQRIAKDQKLNPRGRNASTIKKNMLT